MPEPAPIPNVDNTIIKVYITASKTTVTMTLGEYIVGAMMKELGLGYENEALRAQAIAIRSYILYKIEGGYYHTDGAVACDNINHCMAYMSEAEAIRRYGAENAAYRRSCYREIVGSTAGQVVLYDGKTIQAFFHSSSYKATESCQDAWGGSRPYLQSVSSEEKCKETVMYFTLSELAKAMKLSTSAFTGTSAIGKIIYTESGRVDSIAIYGKVLDGNDLRSALGLASTSFQVKFVNGKFQFRVMGSGHGVGMSQLGADAMAARGCDAIEILTHYYTDCTVGNYQGNIG
ncbi:MAG: SpoIID/LytB domain-containing protein [Ruminococcaceae bacterium]|nr:SpoIID/LytB domain-containing protein [Oscillospiraceae bacterium]